MSAVRTVRDDAFDVLRHFQLTTIFANPGSTEIELLTELPDDLRFVLALHEGSVVGLATGHAIGSGLPALVVLHTTAGLGNAVGALATARANDAPLVVLVGQQDRRHLVYEPFLTGQLRGLAGDYPVWVGEPPRAQDVPSMIARAWHEANVRRGPALVIVPMNDWLEVADTRLELAAPRRIRAAVGADSATIAEVLAYLDAARRPAVVSGAGADDVDIWHSLRRIATCLDAPVWQEPFGARAGFPQNAANFAGHLPAGRGGVRAALEGHDLILVVGAASLRQYAFDEGPLFDTDTVVVGLAADLDDVASSVMDLAVLGSLVGICTSVADALESRAARDVDKPGLTERPVALPPVQAPSGLPSEQSADTDLLTPERVFRALAERMESDTILLEETPSSRQLLNELLPAKSPLGFLSAAMGGLGFALPAAAGVRMSSADRPVIAVVGDGSAMYSIQALWSAQTYGAGVLYIVMSNGGYAIMDHLADLRGGKGPWPQSFGLDVLALARGFGCAGERVETVGQWRALLERVLPRLRGLSAPLLVDVVLEVVPLPVELRWRSV